jgi:hypothetical protein
LATNEAEQKYQWAEGRDKARQRDSVTMSNCDLARGLLALARLYESGYRKVQLDYLTSDGCSRSLPGYQGMEAATAMHPVDRERAQHNLYCEAWCANFSKFALEFA